MYITWKKGKTKVNIGSSSYGVKRGRLRVWSGCEVGVSIAPVFSHSVLGGKRISVWVGAISPYRVFPTRLSSSSGACSVRGLCRLPPPGDPNVHDCPGALDARSRAERHIPPSDYLSTERALPPVQAWFDPPSWIGVDTIYTQTHGSDWG